MCVVPASRHFHILSGWLWATGRRFRLVFASRRCALFPSLSHPDLVLLLLFNIVHSQMKRAMTSLPKNIKYQPSCLAPDQAWPLQLLCQDMFSESEPGQVSTKMQKKNTRTVDSQDGQQQLMTNILIITIFWSQLPWFDDHWSTFQMREEFGCIATVICCSSGNTWSMVLAERIFKDIGIKWQGRNMPPPQGASH